jgi:hypothetical protein
MLRKFVREFSLPDEIISETTANLERTKYMKQIVSFRMIGVTALLALAVGCATTTSTQNTESMLVASGFKVVTAEMYQDLMMGWGTWGGWGMGWGVGWY